MTAVVVRQRASAEERRDQVIRAATKEFAERGYQAASTAAIARRAGISQPYIYALFPNKHDLFLAVCDRVTNRIRDTFARAARGAASPQDALERMGAEYATLIKDRLSLLCQLQSFAAAGDAEIRPHVARSFQQLFDDAVRVSGAPPAEVARFFACGMLANVTTALGLQEMSLLIFETPG